MNVCSKCGGSRVCECGGGNGNGNDVTMWSSGSKILSEQETSDLPATQRGNNEGFSILLSCPGPNSSVLHSHVPSFSPAIGSMYEKSGGGESSERKLFHMNHTKLNLNQVVEGIQSDDSGSFSLIPQFNESDGVSSYSTLELNNTSFNSDNVGTAHANFPEFVVSEIPQPAMPWWSTSVHSDAKPFFNFLEVKDQQEVTDAGSSNDAIDLTLKL